MGKRGSVKVGTIVRLNSDYDKVPASWHGVIGEVTCVEGLDTEGDSLTIKSVCGLFMPVGIGDVECLNIIERLAWVTWRGQLDALHEEVEAFRMQRNHENEWIQTDEIVRISDEIYPIEVEDMLRWKRSEHEPVTAADLEWATQHQWTSRTTWRTGMITRTPKRAGETFSVEILVDDDSVESTVGEEIDVEWGQVFRVEPTPKNGDVE